MDAIKLLRGKTILNIFSFQSHRTLKPRSKFILKILFLFNSKLNGRKLRFNTLLIWQNSTLNIWKSDLSAKAKKKGTNEYFTISQKFVFLKFSSSSSLFSEVGRKICSNKVFVVRAWNKWVVIALEISFPHYRIRIYRTKLAASVTGGRWGDAQANTLWGNLRRCF